MSDPVDVCEGCAHVRSVKGGFCRSCLFDQNEDMKAERAQDKERIKELEAKLQKSNPYLNSLTNLEELSKENAELKQQLAEKDAVIEKAIRHCNPNNTGFAMNTKKKRTIAEEIFANEVLQILEGKGGNSDG